MQSDSVKTQMLGINYEAIIYNNSNSPVIVWPIPTYAPPRLLATVPNKREGIETAPAKLGWPSRPISMVVVAESLLEDFNKMLDDMFAEATKGNPDEYDWTGETYRRLEAKPKTQWVMIYEDPPIITFDLATYVIYNEHLTATRTSAGNLWSAGFPGDNDNIVQAHPYPGYKGVPNK